MTIYIKDILKDIYARFSKDETFYSLSF